MDAAVTYALGEVLLAKLQGKKMAWKPFFYRTAFSFTAL